MIPPAQFDPATLVIWTTTTALASSETEIARLTMRTAADGGDPYPLLDDLPIGDPLRCRLIWLVSSVWHEKRHFFDTCLTNYGARRFRNLFSLAANFFPLVAEAQNLREPVWFPVEVYGYPPLLRKVLGIPEAAPNIIESARLARLMKSFTTQLDAGFTSGKRVFHIGGEAQLEGLAHVSQSGSILNSFGADDFLPASQQYFSKLPQEGPYRAIEAVCGVLGCAKEVGDRLELNPNLAAAMFVTALCGRFFGEGKNVSANLVQPSERFARMFDQLGPNSGRYDMKDDEAAELIDKLARRLWGRTAFEEISADIDMMEEKLDPATVPFLTETGLYDVYIDFVQLRRRILNKAREIGPGSMLPPLFVGHWRDRLRPWNVVATPDGNNPDDEAPVVFGARLNLPAEMENIVSSDVTWGRLYENSEAEFAPHNRKAWIEMLEQHGPRALLMLNGRRHRRMLAPELERPIDEIKKLGIEVRFHPRFEWPEIRDQKIRTSDAMALAHFAGRESFICDITGEEIDANSAAVLTPWEFRRSELLDRFRETGPFSEIMLVTNWTDWVVKRDLLN